MLTYAVDVEFTVSTNIEQSASSVIGAGYERMTVREELDGVDIGLVACKSLDRLTRSDIPQLGEGIAGTRNEGVLVCWVQADTHDITKVVGELDHFGASLNIPLHACHVSGGGQDTPVIDKTTTGEIAGVARQLTSHPSRAIPILIQVVNGANIVQTTARNVVSAWCVGASHDPGRPKRNCVDFVGGVSIPDDELAVLRGGNEMPSVSRPMHGVDLGQMALQRPLGLHQLVLRDRVVSLLRNSAH